MGLILLEAFAALAVLGAIVWWTMFAGRRGGERRVGPAVPRLPVPAASVPPPSVAAATPAAGPGKTPPPG